MADYTAKFDSVSKINDGNSLHLNVVYSADGEKPITVRMDVYADDSLEAIKDRIKEKLASLNTITPVETELRAEIESGVVISEKA